MTNIFYSSYKKLQQYLVYFFLSHRSQQKQKKMDKKYLIKFFVAIVNILRYSDVNVRKLYRNGALVTGILKLDEMELIQQIEELFKIISVESIVRLQYTRFSIELWRLLCTIFLQPKIQQLTGSRTSNIFDVCERDLAEASSSKSRSFSFDP